VSESGDPLADDLINAHSGLWNVRIDYTSQSDLGIGGVLTILEGATIGTERHNLNAVQQMRLRNSFDSIGIGFRFEIVVQR
jgi:hypothetical protein